MSEIKGIRRIELGHFKFEIRDLVSPHRELHYLCSVMYIVFAIRNKYEPAGD